MIEFTQETLVRFRDVPKWCHARFGNRIHPSTVHRWRMRGIRGIRLESVLVGGSRFTSEEALVRFFDKTTKAADGEQLVCSIVKRNQDEAVRFLASEGI